MKIADAKPISWIGSARADLRGFPEEVRRRAGFELRAVQNCQEPTDFKPMPDVGSGVEELRIHSEGAHRVFYVAKFEDMIYVIHAFQKKTRKTARRDLDLGRQRYKDVLIHRKTRKEARK